MVYGKPNWDKKPLSLRQFCKKELKIKLDQRTAEWVLQELEKKLPFEGTNFCDCSADLVYYIDQIRKTLRADYAEHLRKKALRKK